MTKLSSPESPTLSPHQTTSKKNTFTPQVENDSQFRQECTCDLHSAEISLPLCIPKQYSSPHCRQSEIPGLILRQKLTWNLHTRLEVHRRYKLLLRLLDTRSKLTYKLVIYNLILKPIWSYGIELWGLAKQSNIKRL
jgi:hypothetical protein